MDDSENSKTPPTGPEITQRMNAINIPPGVPELPAAETDPLDKGDTLELGPATIIVNPVDGLPYQGGSSPQGNVISEDSTALPITYENMVQTLKAEVLSNKKTREEAEEAIKAFAKDHNLPADSITLNF